MLSNAGNDKSFLHFGHSIETIFPINGQIHHLNDELHDDIYFLLDQSARYVVGDNNGNIGIWRMVKKDFDLVDELGIRAAIQPGKTEMYFLVLVKKLNISELAGCKIISSVCYRNEIILFATKGSEIFEVSEISFLLPNSLSVNPVRGTVLIIKDKLSIDSVLFIYF
jgi:hypothetical protein